PVVPLPDVQVGAADRRLADADQDVVVTDLGLLDARERQARCTFQFGERSHFRIRFRSNQRGMAPCALPTPANAATARSICASVCAALICVRIRALPFGTTGYEKPIT